MASLSSIIASCWWIIIPCYHYVIAELTIDTPIAYDSIPLIMGSNEFLVRWSGMQMTTDDNNMPITNMTMELYLIRQDMVVVASWDRTLNTSSSHSSLILPVNSTTIMPSFENYYLQLLVSKDHQRHRQIAIQGPISFHLQVNTTATKYVPSSTLVVSTAIPSPYFTTSPTDTWITADSATYGIESTTSLTATGTSNESTLVSPKTRAALQGTAIAATAVVIVALVSQLDLIQSFTDTDNPKQVYGIIVCCINHRHEKKKPSKNRDRVVTFDDTTTIIMPPPPTSSPSCTSGHRVNTDTFMGCYYDSEYFKEVVKSNVVSPRQR